MRALNAELEESGKTTGQKLVWSAVEQATLKAIASVVDRKCDLTRDYRKATGASARVAISAELRLLENHLARLLKQISTDAPAQTSNTFLKAQRAANTRWEREGAKSS
jgi:hypothetical protein